MTEEPLRAELDKAPFQPFNVKLTNGEDLKVPHKEFANVSPEGDYVIFFTPDNHYKVVAMEHIVSLTPVRPRKTKGVQAKK